MTPTSPYDDCSLDCPKENEVCLICCSPFSSIPSDVSNDKFYDGRPLLDEIFLFSTNRKISGQIEFQLVADVVNKC